MPFHPEIALISVPMAIYLYTLGLFHGGKHPRVVSGTTDLAWLLGSLSGLLAFGPVGQVVVSAVFGPDATAVAWTVWLVGLTVVAGMLARTGRNRLVVYHVPADQIRPAVGDTLAESGASFQATLQGFEDPSTRTVVLVRTHPVMRTAVIDAQGNDSVSVVARLSPRLKARLKAIEAPVSAISTGFFVASALVMLVPVVAYVAFDPQARRAARTVVRWIGWG